MRSFSILLLLALAGPTATAWASDSHFARAANSSDAAAQGIAPEDVEFLKSAARAAVREQAMGQLAFARGRGAPVRALGQRLVESQAEVRGQLQAFARRAGVSLPTKPNGAQRLEISRLAQSPPETFDRRFLDHLMRHLKQVLTRYRQEARYGRDPSVRAYAKRSLRALEAQLADAASARVADEVAERASG